MVKSPIEYFESLDFTVADNEPITEAEQAFLKKYVGSIANLPVHNPKSIMSFAEEKTQESLKSIDFELKKLDEVLLVSFMLGKSEYTVPILGVQEVIRNIDMAKLPLAPSFVSGVLNLRGKVNPIINLAELIGEKSYDKSESADYVIICELDNIQIGLQVTKIKSLYRAKQDKIRWNIETQLGLSSEFLSALFLDEETILPIVSLDKIFAEV